MRLNNDCVRDLLLAIEENVGLKEYMSIDSLQLKSYSQDDLQYTALKLEEAGYINAKVSKYLDGSMDIYIFSLTWNGHKFLDNIRDNNVWSKTKGIVSKFASVSLDVLEKVAAQVITNMISQQKNSSFYCSFVLISQKNDNVTFEEQSIDFSIFRLAIALISTPSTKTRYLSLSISTRTLLISFILCLLALFH